MNIRNATLDDAPAIAEIYNHYIANSIATFEEDELSGDDMAGRIIAIAGDYPFLVVCEGSTVCGYAYAARWNERSAYRYTVISTIYLADGIERKGHGTALYGALLERLRAQPYRVVIGGISLPNQASVALHEKLGFRKVAHFEQVGFKFGKWIDVGYWQIVF
jgi:L-amino acid N-acyltransferase YncA